MAEKTRLLPREKLLTQGSAALSDDELLALFLRVGVRGVPVLQLAQAVIAQSGSLHGLMSLSYPQFCQIRGLGKTTYSQLHAALEIARRYLRVELTHIDILRHPTAVIDFLTSLLSYRDREVFVTLFLDNQCRVLYSQEMFSGTFDRVEVHPREIMREALKSNAAAIILAHNHPSGQVKPSFADRKMTEKIVKTCQLLEIKVLDHIIIGKGNYLSFAEKGWL